MGTIINQRGMRHKLKNDVLKVYVVAHFEPLRVGLVNTIANVPDLEVVGQAASLREMIHSDGYRGADVLAIDVQALNTGPMPDFYSRLAEQLPGLRILFLGSPQDARATSAITYDAMPMLMRLDTIGFLIKDGPADRFVQAIRLVASGAFVCETEVIKRILTRLTQWADYAPSDDEHLSEREAEVLGMVAQGQSNKEIARELFLSEGTVKAHISHILSKLSLDRRTELVRYALTKGVVSVPEE